MLPVKSRPLITIVLWFLRVNDWSKTGGRTCFSHNIIYNFKSSHETVMKFAQTSLNSSNRLLPRRLNSDRDEIGEE